MRALVTLSHGSRHPHAEAGVVALTRVAGELAGTPSFAAHLEFNEPDLTTTCVRLAEQGFTEAVVVPLLFTSAYHHKVDVPQAVEDARRESGLNVTLVESIGTGEDLAQLLAHRVLEEAPAGSHIALYSVGSSDAKANDAVSALATQVETLSGYSVTSIKATGSDKGCLQKLAESLECRFMHILPLFITDGLLLDRAWERMPVVAEFSRKRITHSQPLTTALADIVAARFAGASLASA